MAFTVMSNDLVSVLVPSVTEYSKSARPVPIGVMPTVQTPEEQEQLVVTFTPAIFEISHEFAEYDSE